MDQEKLIEVCPVCGNADLYYEVGGYAGAVYHCKECGYVGAFVIEANEEMIEKIRENYLRGRVIENNKKNENK
ncbi:hypothetical protein MSBR3_1945 [Methanosarcina barkeri 3]|uniref:Uncharacterized protein n=1 Tax=Methanosarcina barkeri 3 TaxID=1434107 RepID=A0A0E3SN39_METBA|nr:hypothetical protein [Methanosarcina barkeri]AKB82523.1 hypothetical protein MSBR3_1945 [Methanosarcina barkeri 3]